MSLAPATRAPSRPPGRFNLSWPAVSLAFFILASTAAWTHVLLSGDGPAPDLLAARAWQGSVTFIQDLLGIGSPRTPAFLEPAKWARTANLAIETLAMSVLAIGLAGAGTLVTMMLGARNVMLGDIAGTPSHATRGLFFVVRGLFAFTRSVPELVWAMLIVFVLTPGMLPAALALAIHNYGILARLCAEVVENADPRPARALITTGAGKLQVLAYGVLPQALPQFLTFLLYRWEMVIRTTIVVGFVSAGGLGRDFRLAMSFFHYTDVTLILAWYLLLVVGVDLASASLRRLAR